MTKVDALVSPDASVDLAGPPAPYVSRGGEKLAAALARFDVEVAGRDWLDAGASTGGFTDCLLQNGASRVVAVDVGYGQLDWSLRNDARVIVLERTNARSLAPDDLPFAAQGVTADLAFISLEVVLRALRSCAVEDADFVLLVKPQFEAGRDAVGRGGVVRDPTQWRTALGKIVEAGGREGLGLRAAMPSPLRGPAGNVEFFVHLRKDGVLAAHETAEALDAAVAEVDS